MPNSWEVSDGIFVCAADGCEAFLERTSKWTKIKNSNWFFQKDGTVWCPDHIPEWVEEWRKKKQGELK